MSNEALISRIEAAARRRGVEPSTITRRAVRNRRLYQRLKAGGDMKLSTAIDLESYLREDEGDKHTPPNVKPAAPPQDLDVTDAA